MKKILILGGTQFIGRNLVERLLTIDEYEITLFNRQQTQAELFPDVMKIKGDRLTDDIQQIASIDWDYVIDLSCYYPDSLINVIQYLNDSVKKYLFISTCSVYDNEYNRTIHRNEKAEILSCSNIQRTDTGPESYGNRKAECERVLKDSGMDYLIFRPALVYGQYDVTDRFYYWLYQVRHNHSLLLPDNGERLFSLTYIDDLVTTITEGISLDTDNKVYNVITNPKASIGQIVDCAKELLYKDPRIINAKPDFLHQNGISQWTDMPLWIDGDHFTYDNELLQTNFEIELTSLKDGVKATLDYYQGLDWPKPEYGMSENMRVGLISKILQN